MSLLAPPPAFYQIEDRIDAIGQKYRAQRIVRGAMLFVAALVALSFAAALVAHFLGHGVWTRIVLGAWAGGVLLAAWRWIARPLLIRPDAVEVARFVESRVEGLHNGLTNGLLLSRRTDLAESPWLPEIFNEISENTFSKPLGGAVKMSDLAPLGYRLMGVVIPMIALAMIFPRLFFQGWSQLLSPAAFVPTVGNAEIIDVQPKDVTVVTGQPLEITVVARCANSPKAKLIFEKGDGAEASAVAPANAELIGSAAVEAGQKSDQRSDLQYNYRLEHVDQPTRYRVEVAGTQSPWYAVTVVRQVKLQQLEFRVLPPSYTRQEIQSMIIKAADLSKANITVPQGSRVELAAMVDVPMGGAMLEGTSSQPVTMETAAGGKRFSTAFTVLDETPIALLFTQGGKQIVARLPEESLAIHCLKDQPPTIEMKWPATDVTVAPDAELKIRALFRDDYGVASARVLMATDASAPAVSASNPPAVAAPGPSIGPVQPAPASSPDDKAEQQLTVAHEESFSLGTGAKEAGEFAFALPVKPELRKHGNSIRVQVEITDNRDLTAVMSGLPMPKDGAARDTGGPQTVGSAILTIKFQDPAITAKDQKDQADKLRARLTEMLRIQRGLNDQTIAAKTNDRDLFLKVATGQADLRTLMKTTAEGFHFEPDELIVQKVLLKLTFEEAKEAVDQATSLQSEPGGAARKKLDASLQFSQRHIIDALETLLARLSMNGPTTQPNNKQGNDPLLSNADALKKLDEALKEFMKQEQKILDQTSSLAKKPVDNWDASDKKKMEDLKMAQEKMDAFMQEKMHDFSKNSEQDMANSSALKQLMEVVSETTMAKDALKAKAAEVAVAAEENGIDNAKTLTSNIEKWLSNAPDRTKWTQEDLAGKTDLNMPELPKELEDLVGALMEKQEDLFDDMEDANSNMATSGDKGIGWDAADGPIASMNAQGVTGNQLPNNNEMNGRSGEGRSGKSQGEFVEDHASGKGGRNTPTRLDPTPFQKGEVKDDSKDPTGGATGGGKTSGQGGEGLEGPVPPKQQREMQRLAQKQAQLRNAAERLSLQYKVGKYDNFKLDEAISLMRRVESDIHANRYVNALRKRDVTLDALDTSRLLVGGEVHVQRDTTPGAMHKTQDQINDAMKGELPPAWSDALKEYYRKLSQQ
ncbi:MAG TPA: hypothetical protein VG326_20060 [Tepidisphaeraceae bacterium]|jgi:hypothetical protein|nr:hypothetical protein [Tepidisphaeraceae bacterium]